MKKIRYRKLDAIRGIALINMIAYHAIWDLVYLYGFQWNWYQSEIGYIWQQGICWTFIFLSGFCCSLGRNPIKRGLTVFLAGAVITAVTLVIMPENRVVFGVLTLIGSCMVIAGVFERQLNRFRPLVGVLLSFGLFLLTRNVNGGWLGFERFRLCKVEPKLYSNLVTTYFGFPMNDFYSTDYFSVVPWLFLFMAGYFLFQVLEKTKAAGMLEKSVCVPLEWLGRHSLPLYMLHQPVIYGMFELIFLIVK